MKEDKERREEGCFLTGRLGKNREGVKEETSKQMISNSWPPTALQTGSSTSELVDLENGWSEGPQQSSRLIFDWT